MAMADVTFSFSVGEGFQGNLITPNTSVTIPAYALAEGSAPPGYDDTNGLNSVDFTSSLATVTTGVISTEATSNVDGLSGPRTTTASSSVANLNVAVLGNLVSLTATSLSAFASVSGDVGAFDTSASHASVTGLQLLVAGQVVNLSGLQPNTPLLLSANGVTFGDLVFDDVLINNGLNSTSIQVSALQLDFNNSVVPGYGQLDGIISIGGAFALESNPSVTGVPEPSSLVLIGFAGAWFGVRMALRFRRRFAVAAPAGGPN